MMAPTKSKSTSLVVMGGWLGCKPKYLKSYESLYNSLGFDSLSVVASPLCVIDATLHRQNSSKIRVPSLELRRRSSNVSTNSWCPDCDTRMQALAWKVLGDIYNSKAEEFIFHAFSNGGCLLWESMCNILQFKDNKNCDPKISAILKQLHDKCKGLVFDSCPGWFGAIEGASSKLWQALQYCSEEEKKRIHSVYGDQIRTVDKHTMGRSLEYFENLTRCTLDVPQLYLYSKDDDLAKHEYISKIIDTRRRRQKRPVFKQVWETSIHCKHLLEHRDDYQKALHFFVQQLEVPIKARL